MTTYHLNLAVERFEPSTPDGQDGTSTTVARVNGEFDDPAMVATHLWAVADRLDPPKPVLRRREDGPVPRGLEQAARLAGIADAVPVQPWMRRQAGTGCAGGACDEAHTYEVGCLLRSAPSADEPRRARITPDGCGPEHTFTGSCHLAVPGRPD